MICPVCGSEYNFVRETAQGTDGKVYRRRRCSECEAKFRTVEVVMDDSDSSRKDYSEAMRNKSPLIRGYYDNKNA
jgi:transcriptional regulator NrdR family protein